MLRNLLRQSALAVSAICLTIAVAAPTASCQTYTSNATNGVTQLQTWYSSSSGLYAWPSGWWNAANSITLLANYERAIDDNSYESTVISNTYTQAQSANAGFLNDYDDDEGWWGLTWIDAYDLTGKSTYLTMAESIFANVANEWDTTECGGGVWWRKSLAGDENKGAVENELFFTMAAKLANRTTGSTSAGYLAWAQTAWNWFNASGLINSSNLINNNLVSNNGLHTGACTNALNTAEYTYNQGIILGGLVELYQADGGTTLLPQATAIANAVLNSGNGFLTSGGVLQERTGVSGGDAPQFKGIFVRNLVDLYKATNNPAYQSFLDANANSIWAHDRSTNSFGALWQGAFDSADATRQTSALDAIVGAVTVQGSASVGPIQENGFGSLEMVATDSGGNVYHDWQNFGAKGGSAPSSWSGFSAFTMGNLRSNAGAVIAMDSTNRQIVVIPSTTGDIYYNQESNPTGGWSGWTDMGSSSNGLADLHALNDTANGGLYVFGRDSSGYVWSASKSGPNASWTSFTQLTGESVQAGYTVAENANTGYLEVFGVDTSGTVWTNSQISLTAWSGWSSIIGESVKPHLAVSRNLNGKLELFGYSLSNSHFWTISQGTPGGTWGSWSDLGVSGVGTGYTLDATGFAVGMNANGILELFDVGSNGALYHLWQVSAGGSWGTTWSYIGGGSISDPNVMVTTTADGRQQVFVIGTASPYNIYSSWQTSPSGPWNGWLSFGSGKVFYPGQP